MKKENQIGCGYCAHELTCNIQEPHVNKAKEGCAFYKHHEDNKTEKS